jgi:acetoin utilization deacetylase AcuC-like enzyme
VLAFDPEIVFYQSGVDALASDALGRLALSHAGLLKRDGMVMEAVHRENIPFVVTLGGGYSKPVELTALEAQPAKGCGPGGNLTLRL